MQLTVIICTHNRAHLLARVIDSLNKASRSETIKVNILVIANACTDSTIEYLKTYQNTFKAHNHIHLSWVEELTPGKSFALNRAIQLINTPYIAFVDDDHRVDSKYLYGIEKSIKENPEATIFCGRIHPDWQGNEPGWIHDTGPYRIYPLPIPRFDLGDSEKEITTETPIPGGGNIFMHTDVFERIGNFSTDLGPKRASLGGSEDTDFILRALVNNEKILYMPTVLQYHYVDLHRLKLSYLLRKSYHRSCSITLVSNKNASKIPRYLWKKLFIYMINSIFSARWEKRRFSLMRTAATLGEISAYYKIGHS